MVRCVGLALAALLFFIAPTAAQQSSSPTPLYPGARPPSVEQQALPPPPSAPSQAVAPSDSGAPGTPAPATQGTPVTAAGSVDRVFCEQPVSLHVADRDSVPERFRDFIGMFSDAAWSSDLCAALVVENVGTDGTATIVYAFGPMGSNAGSVGGVLRGAGIIRNGELRFQNSDGSQFAFRPLYDDLDGRLTSPKGQMYQAVFKRTP
jgi:hypothetical protein